MKHLDAIKSIFQNFNYIKSFYQHEIYKLNWYVKEKKIIFYQQ